MALVVLREFSTAHGYLNTAERAVTLPSSALFDIAAIFICHDADLAFLAR